MVHYICPMKQLPAGYVFTKASRWLLALTTSLLGVAFYLRRRNKPYMILAVLLMYECLLCHEEERSVTERKVIGTERDPNEIVQLWSETKTGKIQSVVVCKKFVHKLLLPRFQKINYLNRKYFRSAKRILEKISTKLCKQISCWITEVLR